MCRFWHNIAEHDVTKTPFPQKFIDGFFSWYFGSRRQIDAGAGTENFVSIYAAVFALWRKSGRGHNLSPPPPAGRGLTPAGTRHFVILDGTRGWGRSATLPRLRVSKPSLVKLSGKHRRIALDEYWRLVVRVLVLGQIWPRYMIYHRLNFRQMGAKWPM